MPAQRITRTTYGKRANGRATRSAQLDDDDDPMVVPTKVTESKKPPSASRVGSALKGKEFDIPVVRTSGVRRPSTTVPRPPDASIRTPSKPAAISKASLRSSGSLSSPNDLEASDDEMEIAELVRMSAPPADTAKSIGKRKEQVTNEPSSPSRVKRQRLEAYVDVPSVSKSRVHTAQPVVTGKVSPAKPATAVPPQTVKRAVPIIRQDPGSVDKSTLISDYTVNTTHLTNHSRTRGFNWPFDTRASTIWAEERSTCLPRTDSVAFEDVHFAKAGSGEENNQRYAAPFYAAASSYSVSLDADSKTSEKLVCPLRLTATVTRYARHAAPYGRGAQYVQTEPHESLSVTIWFGSVVPFASCNPHQALCLVVTD
ncbi:hypothetical protein CALVIDRAFT_561977 [Calocera viscosa TUFC12733]|uniref:Uncharacterized protein n=1 Tax=Calocera viscosa (strain TUFC12733) TaxID=1330018 RepID=A0A167P8E9_CALVF|nr:hypothetical protein CALVIDRAFT_561977 [Calocera viscosa TUFC12733]